MSTHGTPLASVLLVFFGAALWWFVRQDVADYARFKTLQETADRQNRYRVWILKSFALFTGGSLVGLAMMGRLHALLALPSEFASLSLALASRLQAHLTGSDFVVGLVGGAAIVGIALGILVQRVLRRTSGSRAVGDIRPMMPRNVAETMHVALLSLNAGLGEELFFRLFFPLLLTVLLRNVAAALLIAGVIFGLVHWYQGLVGVMATMVLGFALEGLYLATGSIWIAVSAHSLLDLIGLVVRPTLARWLAFDRAGTLHNEPRDE